MNRWFFVAPLLISFPALATPVGEMRVEVFAYAGTQNPTQAPHVSYVLEKDHSLRAKQAGMIDGDRYLVRTGSAARIFDDANASAFSPEGRCRNLLQGNQELAIQEMFDRGVITAEDKKTLGASFSALDTRQITFVQVKKFTDAAEHALDGVYRPAREDLVHEDLETYLSAFADHVPSPKSATGNEWRNVGSAWLVSGQLLGAEKSIPLETSKIPGFPAIDRKRYPFIFEVGRTAHTSDANLQQIFPFLSQRLQTEALALGQDPKDLMIFAHTVQPTHTRLYQRYGAEIHWQSADGKEAVLRISYATFRKMFNPEPYALPSFEAQRAIEKFRRAYRTRYRHPKGGASIGLRFFGEGWRQDLEIPAAIDRRWREQALSLGKNDLIRFDVNDLRLREPGMISRYHVETRDRYGSYAFDLTRFLRDHRAIEIDLEDFTDVTPGNFGQIVSLAAAFLTRELRERGIANPAAWLRERKLKLSFLTRDKHLASGLKSPEIQAQTAAEIFPILNHVTTSSGSGFFTRERVVERRGHWVVLLDASKVVDAAELGTTTNVERYLAGWRLDLEDLIRSDPDLD